MPDGGPHPRCVVILTAIPVEYEAVRAHLTDLRREKHGRVIYQRGTFSTANQVWDVVIRETGPGNVRAAVETLLAIHYFDPALVLFIGVAGGLKDVRLGDVVVPTKVYAYESGRANVDSFQARPQIVTPTFPLMQLAQAEAKEKDWLRWLTKPIPDMPPQVRTAPIASGESVVASPHSAIYKFLRTNYSDAVAVEMESYGFLLAVYFHPEVDALVIRGISDLIKNKQRTDRSNFQALAARHASAFAFEILAKIDVADLQRSRIEPNIEPAGTADRKAANPNEVVAEIHDTLAVSTDHTIVALHDPDIEMQHEAEIAPTTSRHPQQFFKQIEQHKGEIRKLQDLFGEGRMPSADQCSRAIQLTVDLEALIREYYKHITHSNRAVKFEVKKLKDQIQDLLSELKGFLYTHSSAKPDHYYTTSQKNIYNQFGRLLEKLGQLEKLDQIMNES